MPKRDEHQHQSPKDVPPVGRPRGAVWRSLQADGVVWEGQVLLVGDDVDLAARMIVTHRRIAFVRGGDVVLEIPRGWLRQEPLLRRDGVLDLFVATPESKLFDEPQRVPIRMREGHPAAGHIIAMLAPGGVRRIEPEAMSALERARETAAAPRYNGFWEGIESSASSARRDPLREVAGQQDESGQKAAQSLAGMPPIEPPDRVLRVSSTPPRPLNGNAFPIAGIMPRDQRRSPWSLLLRLAALTVLLATAAALGAGRLNIHLPGAGMPAILAAPTATPASTSTGEPATSADAAMPPADLTAVALGVGGPAAQSTNEPATATAEPAAASAAAAPTVTAPETVIPTPAATAASVAPTAPAPTTTPPSPTSAPAPATEAPAPGAGAASPPSAASTPVASAAQDAAFAADTPPAQEIVAGPMRVAIASAQRAESLPRYGLPPGSGDWVLLMIDITNLDDQPASLAMADFRLFDRGTGVTVNLDSGVNVIASLAGFDPVRAAGDTISAGPGEATKALLLFLIPPGGSDDLALLVGAASMDLGPSVALGEAAVAAAPILVPAMVTNVENGGHITVEIDGAERQVQYLGIAVPEAGACFAAEAAAANSELVAGQQVWLERQATEAGADGVLPRDVWIAGPDGSRVLVAARLLEAGAGTAAAVAPDTRYQAWLSASEALARSNGAGLWSACPAPAASA